MGGMVVKLGEIGFEKVEVAGHYGAGLGSLAVEVFYSIEAKNV